MKIKNILLVAFALSALSTTSFAQKVDTDWDHNANFSNYKTYAWMDNKNGVKEQLWDQRIVQNIDSQMAAKGFRQVARNNNPDILLVYHAGVKQNVSVMGYNYGYGPGWRWGGGMGMTRYDPVVENVGTLVVDMVDGKSNQVVWRGTASDTLSDKSDKNVGKLQKTVTKLFSKYPPKH